MAEETIDLPLNVIKASTGFAMDIGGSMAKLVYRSNEDFCGGEPIRKHECPSGNGPLRKVLVSREKINDIIALLRDKCDLTENINGERAVFCTGIGGNEFSANIQSGLDVKLTNLPEFDCFASALHVLLKTKSNDEIFEPVNEVGLKMGIKRRELFSKLSESLAPRGRLCDITDYAGPPIQNEGSQFPFLMAMCGSAFGWFKVEEDGSYVMLGGGGIGGRFFLGLVSFLTNITDFDEISRLLEESSGDTVDTFLDELVDAESKDDGLYSQFATCERMRAFPMGKGLTDARDKATPGDLIHSVLETVCDNLAVSLIETVNIFQIPRIYFAGNFVNTPKAQQMLTTSFEQLEQLSPLDIDYKFLKNGGFLGSVGAYTHAHSLAV